MTTVNIIDELRDRLLPAPLRDDPPRNEERIKIRVNVRPRSTEICGQLVKHGVREITIYKSDLAKVEALVEDDIEGLKRAQEAFESARDRWVNAQLQSVPADERDVVRPKILRKFFSQAHASQRAPEAFFHQFTGRGVRPLVGKPEIVEDAIPAPKTELQERIDATSDARKAEMQAMGEAIGKAMGEKIAAVLERAAGAQRK